MKVETPDRYQTIGYRPEHVPDVARGVKKLLPSRFERLTSSFQDFLALNRLGRILVTRSTTELREMVMLRLPHLYMSRKFWWSVLWTFSRSQLIAFELPKMHSLFHFTALQWHLSTLETLLCILCGWTGIPSLLRSDDIAH